MARTNYPTPTGPRCGQCHSRHANAAAVRECYEQDAEQAANAAAEFAAEAAVERYFEDRGYWAARADEDWERTRGVVGFTEAWDLESPGTRPGWHDDHCTPTCCTCR